MRTGTGNRKGVYKQCANEKCKSMFYCPPGQPDLKCCSIDCRTARKAQENARIPLGIAEPIERKARARRDAIGLRKAVFDDTALCKVMMGKAPKIDKTRITLRNKFPDE